MTPLAYIVVLLFAIGLIAYLLWPDEIMGFFTSEWEGLKK